MTDSEIRKRIRDVMAKYQWWEEDGNVEVTLGKLYGLNTISDPTGSGWTAQELRDLANALDGQDDANDAMFQDLKEESAAYQRGFEDGKRKWAEGMANGTQLVVMDGELVVLSGAAGRHKTYPRGPFT